MMTTEKKCNEKTTLQEELQGFLNLFYQFFSETVFCCVILKDSI